jgi:transcription elongation GreA/GreB family factor
LFSQIDITSQHPSVQIGSLVKTNKGTFLIGVATQGILVQGIKVFGISALSPLGQKLLGKKIGDSIEVNGMQHKIETID